jgi:hypothetical protein
MINEAPYHKKKKKDTVLNLKFYSFCRTKVGFLRLREGDGRQATAAASSDANLTVWVTLEYRPLTIQRCWLNRAQLQAKYLHRDAATANFRACSLRGGLY